MRIRATKTEFQGQIYDSASEANVAAILELKRKSKQIAGWTRGEAQTLVHGPTRERTITYKPDFIVTLLDGTCEAWDAKGLVRKKATMGKRGVRKGRLSLPRDFRLRAILWENRFPNVPVVAVDRDGQEAWRLK